MPELKWEPAVGMIVTLQVEPWCESQTGPRSFHSSWKALEGVVGVIKGIEQSPNAHRYQVGFLAHYPTGDWVVYQWFTIDELRVLP